MPIERHFTSGSVSLKESMRFVIAGAQGEASPPHMTVPSDWSMEAANAFAPALSHDIPLSLRAIEENTTPSWLWQHRAADPARTSETSMLEVVNRIAGAATYRGWKKDLWEHEVEALAFHDELHALLLTRRIVLSAQDMAKLGTDWAYGEQAFLEPSSKKVPATHTAGLILQNETIDSILRRTQPLARAKWMKFLDNSQTKPTTHIAFADTISQWGVLAKHHDLPRAMINLSAFAHDDGGLDTAGLKQASRIAVYLLELFFDDLGQATDKDRSLAIGLGNLASLLMGQGISYDSDKGRGTAAALAAIITGTATATSAIIASKLGPCPSFGMNRERSLRSLKNKLRASFSEQNDYEHLSILPQTLGLESGTDLVLISDARHACEEALRLAQAHGLRNLQLTSLYCAPDMMPVMDATSCGIDAEQRLTCDYSIGADQFERRIRPSLLRGLEKLGYEQDDINAIHDHVVGYRTLVAAPAINHSILREKGFDDLALRRVESLLPFVDHIRTAFTPWVVGLAFCKGILGLNEKELANPHVDLLCQLGFSAKDVSVANAFCCGHRSVRGITELDPAHTSIFATQAEISPDAQIKMAAAIQGFVTGEVSLSITIPHTLASDIRGDMILKAWELGIKSITLLTDAPLAFFPEVSIDRPLMRRQTPRMTTQRPPDSASHIKQEIRKPKAPQHTLTFKVKKGASKTGLRAKRS